jgi:hypothetical protein
MRYRKDRLVTDRFLLKGHANTGNHRLSTFLNNSRKHFLEMDDVTLIKHDGSENFTAEWMLVHMDDIILAHEIEETGDEGLKGLSERQKDEISVTVHFDGNSSLRLSGKVRKSTLNISGSRPHDFIVMVEPEIRGLPIAEIPEYGIFENLSYVIVNRKRIAFITQ